MRRWAFLLSLLAALAGTPLRHAEAAADLGRSLAELLQAHIIEPVDGGVGDDSGDGTLTASHGITAELPVALDHLLLPPPSSPVLAPDAEEGLSILAWWPQAPPRQRHSWLQVFRF